MGVECTISEIFVLGQLLIAAMCSSYGEPFRQEWYTNNWLVGWLTTGTIGIAFMCLDSSNSVLQYVMPMTPLPASFGKIILGYFFLNAILSLWLKGLVDSFFLYKTTKKRPVPLFTPALRHAHDADARKAMDALIGHSDGREAEMSGDRDSNALLLHSMTPTERSEIY